MTDKWWDGIEVWACGKDKWLIECETTVLGAVPEVAEDVWWCKCGGELGSLLMRTEFGDGEEGGDELGTPRWDIPLEHTFFFMNIHFMWSILFYYIKNKNKPVVC